eukprot:9723062-Alexandrium_andersonii.AAC.1
MLCCIQTPVNDREESSDFTKVSEEHAISEKQCIPQPGRNNRNSCFSTCPANAGRKATHVWLLSKALGVVSNGFLHVPTPGSSGRAGWGRSGNRSRLPQTGWSAAAARVLQNTGRWPTGGLPGLGERHLRDGRALRVTGAGQAVA